MHAGDHLMERNGRPLWAISVASLGVVGLAFVIRPWSHYTALCSVAMLVDLAIAAVAFFQARFRLAGRAFIAAILVLVAAIIVPNLEKA